MEFLIKQLDNKFELYQSGYSQKILFGHWNYKKGKYEAEIFEENEKPIFYVKRKFNLWKWNLSYLIKNVLGKDIIMTAKNKWHSNYLMEINEDQFELKIHKLRKQSIFKNGIQIAKTEESLVENISNHNINLTAKGNENLREIFLMVVCLKIGEQEYEGGNSINFGNIGKMESIDENWKP